MKRNAIILAAGKGTRMKSKLYKVLHPVLGKPMVEHVVDNLDRGNVEEKIVVVGHGADEVKSVLEKSVKFTLQSEQLGTGHAVMMAEDLLKNQDGTTVVICGDTPLITTETIDKLINFHEQNESKATILSANMDDPTGYGRIIRDNQEVMKIVEHKDATEKERQVSEINTGTYCFDNKLLFKYLNNISNENKQGEYYLTDVIEIFKKNRHKVLAYLIDDASETIGVNDRVSLARAEELLKKRINNQLMVNGVSIIDPNNTYISCDTEIETDTIIYPGTTILGKNKIGSDCIIGPNTHLENVEIGNSTTIKQSVITDSIVGNHTNVGPFAHFRKDAKIGNNGRIGNFVEIKNTTFGNNSSAAHLAYMGDASIGEHVNMGCGAITVNYDGTEKHKTVIGDHVFIGCNANLIAPIEIDDHSVIAAGSTLNQNVPKYTLAIARSRQINKEGYVKNSKNM
ncbi:bifunctional UDP-N-acetylglucosamine diphosphorylase/glucosamine-1-phosphate N-acetyltransferase GlmU [Haloplasma contractile]|uniref:Bifunctional protein GlmU n=1 Tax=Haloplasma contractile SSD-17B TaxID=1033810 RepID=U2EBL5_9MOLU|nr:bifunctional UDP-N-acetylglucosamine diphosphorylase/glucosamine-1-phosphate N-acetyltransferase GlmU [Haloplasma contractile]ERJ12463.1 Bifunctional protein GlmU [Haloplasma contractile SSD-17B]